MNTPQPRKRLPVNPSIEHLQKQAKRLVKQTSGLKLAQAQHQLAREYGLKNWAELVAVVKSMSIGADEQQPKFALPPLAEAANQSDLAGVRRILDSGQVTQHDLDLALARATLILGQRPERRPIAELLLERGADPNGQYGSNYGPIILAACECLDPEGIEFLINAGADVSFGPLANKYGTDNTPINVVLSTYVRGRNTEKHRCIDLLIAHGAQCQDDVLMDIHRGNSQRLEERIKKDHSLMQMRFDSNPDPRRVGNIDLRGATLLHLAVEFGEKECIDVLLSHYHGHPDAETNSPSEIIDGVGGQTPIYHAISTQDGSVDGLEHFLRRAGQHIDMEVRATFRLHGKVIQPALPPLEYALHGVDESHASPEKKKELRLLRGADRKGQLKEAIRRGDVDAVARQLDAHPELLQMDLWPPAIYEAKSLPITRLLLERGLDPNQCSAPRLPLHLAVYQVLPDVVQALVDAGADADRMNALGERPIELLDAYEPRSVGNPEVHRIKEILISAGARLDFHSAVRMGDLPFLEKQLREGGSIPPLALHIAARSRRVEVTRFLLEQGAVVDELNEKGNTPLWFAAQGSSPGMNENRAIVIGLLLDAGADLHRRCEDGSTALHMAACWGPVEIVYFLLARGARNWVPDKNGKLPVDYASERESSADKEAILALFKGPRIDDPIFRQAVDAISAGDLDRVQQLLREHPGLLRVRAEENGEYAGNYFSRPTLLHFIAENPTRTGKLPENICAITQALIDAGAEVDAVTQGGDNHTTLALVATSEPARKQNLQLPLIELLVKNGADPRKGYSSAIVHREHAAINLLVRLASGEHTLLSAASMGDEKELQKQLAQSHTENERIEAANVVVIEGLINCLKLLVATGVSINARVPHHPYSPTLLHQAASFGQSAMAEWLLEHGADPTATDTQFRGTPADWAHESGHTDLEARLRQSEIVRSKKLEYPTKQ